MKLLIVAMSCFFLACTADTFSGDDAAGDAGGDAKVGFHPDASDGDIAQDSADGGESADVDGGDGSDGFIPPTFKRVFISSQQWQASLGGPSGADAKCDSIAKARSLGGSWVAWLSTLSSSAALRMTHSSLPYKLLDGTLVANNWADLTSGGIQNPINIDENGYMITWNGGTGSVYTSTYTDGTSMLLHGAKYDCEGLTNANAYDTDAGSYESAVIGYDNSSGKAWTDSILTTGCSSFYSLYCFEQ